MRALPETRPQPDEQLDTVAHTARRRLLLALLDETPAADTPIRIDDRRDDLGISESMIAMQHSHLPKLESRGFVRWDREHALVTRGPQFDEIEPLLTLLYEHRDELPDEWL